MGGYLSVRGCLLPDAIQGIFLEGLFDNPLV
ncbi:hypothetical protein CbuD7D7780_01525 [Coxiella burnetii]|uniref:Uncharacterized protein n=1 Tax=Coxiella burnetii (strain Dugway 5J108-111) TaxID=434922 RepID=B5XHQ2_COXBN|nr:hypothetical protein [Coxiella burnetii]ACI23082.1 hypothetical protein CBUD_0298a [Coxiella burnetii Dugway 5J108-111]OYK80994.1 hypothetical protein CbuD7E6568_01515 [Coxiella burnetii]OYK83082.1 hypothetical protein CbuD7D7780_01525 [Coxiella burnetii]